MLGNSRILGVVVVALGVFLAVGAPAVADSLTPSTTLACKAPLGSGERAVVRVIISYRAKNGVRPLMVGAALSRAAQSHSADMARRGYFDHGAFATRLRSFGVRAPYVGENLAAGSRPLTPAATVRLRLQRPAHR